MNPLLERPSALLAKIETTKGTPATISATDGQFNVFDVAFKETTPFTKREKQNGAGNLAGRPGAAMGTCSFRANLENSGTATPPAILSTFLPACAMPFTTGVYTRTLDTSLQSTLTVSHFKGAGTSSIKQTLAGAMGKCRITGRNGQVNDIYFDLTGKYWEEDTATLLDPTKPTTNPPRGFESFTVGGISGLAPEFTLDFGQTVKLLEGPNDANNTGYVHAIVTDFDAKLTFEPYAEPLSVIDWRDKFINSIEMALTAVFGEGANNLITLAASKLQLVSGPGFGTRERAYTRVLEFQINDDNGPTVTLS